MNPGIRRVPETQGSVVARAISTRESRRSPPDPCGHELASSKVIAAPRTGHQRQLAADEHALWRASSSPAVKRHDVAVEQYRRLAATLHGLQVERGLKTLMVTSTVPEEGKTLTVANLALTLSESYKRRVLLIDADLRRPSIHQVFGLPNVTGLSDGLRSDRGQLPVLEVSVCLSVVTAGQPDANPMAKLTSRPDGSVARRGCQRVRLGPSGCAACRPHAGCESAAASHKCRHVRHSRRLDALSDDRSRDRRCSGRECIIGTVSERRGRATFCPRLVTIDTTETGYFRSLIRSTPAHFLQSPKCSP